MRLRLIARPGYAPLAIVMPPDNGPKATHLDRWFKRGVFARRLLGDKASYDGALSSRWKSEVFCTPEFSKWWRLQPNPPPAEYQIFLRTLTA